MVTVLIASAVAGVAQDADNLARKALDDPAFEWRSIESSNARVYYQAGSYAERHREMFLRSVEKMIEEVMEYLGEPGHAGPLDVFYLNSREEMKRIVGSPVTGFANWSAKAIFVVCSPQWRSFEKHEFTHNVTMGIWGRPHEKSGWMVEGISIACDGWCRGYSVDEIAYHYLSNGELPPIGELFENMRSLGEIRGGMYAASVIGYIRETYGTDAVRELWLKGVEKFTRSVDIDFNQLETGWRDYLDEAVDPKTQVDIQPIDEMGCG